MPVKVKPHDDLSQIAGKLKSVYFHQVCSCIGQRQEGRKAEIFTIKCSFNFKPAEKCMHVCLHGNHICIVYARHDLRPMPTREP